MSDSNARDDKNLLSDDEFRARLRDWVTTHYPEDRRQSHHRPFRRLYGRRLREWLKTLNDHGWRAPAWPKEYGGMGLSFRKQLIYKEEMHHAGVSRIVDNGETMLGPTIMQHGTSQQKALYLPRILASEDHWAQGYSEPNAGSDLASLGTRAELRDDHFVVNGQKIWTTFATECTHIFCLVRTGQFEKKQQGISLLLFDLQQPGITIRPILNIAGEEELCEVFFDDVKVPKDNLLGELHQGWTVAKAILGHERIWVGSHEMASSALALSYHLIRETAQDTDPLLLDELAGLTADLHDYKGLYADACDEVERTGQISAEVSMLKIYASELMQRITEFNVRVVREYSLASGDVRVGETLTNPHWQLMMARPTTIYAGCNEVQRDILSASMGLPRR